MDTTFIYALKEPNGGKIRYVGKTNNPKTRLTPHISESRTKKHHRACWIKALLAKGLKPLLEVIDEVPFEHWPQLEAAYIEFFLESGCDLTNATPGGEDPPSFKGRKHSPEFGAAVRARRLGKKASQETILKQSVAKRGKKHTEAHNEKIKISNLLAQGTPEKRKQKALDSRCKKRADNTSGFVGVVFIKHLKKWWARINVEGKVIPLGYYKDKYDAVFVRRLAEDKYFV